jgi:NTE family protein
MENHTFPREISLCLSGGGARGAYHLGAISVLEEHGVAIKAISGTSIGALIGAALACGKTSAEIFESMRSKAFRNIFSFAFSSTHLFSIDIHSSITTALIDQESFEALQIPLCVAACDMNTQTIHYFSSGDRLKELVLASCSIVPVFKPILFNEMLLADGGMIDNFPVEQLQKFGYPIIGINLFPSNHISSDSIAGLVKNVLFTTWQAHNIPKKALCHLQIGSAELYTLKTFSFKDLNKAYELGKKEMQMAFTAH